ncbi:Aspartyl-tRNA(Asn) amidotransferase subunit A @ Glutamyl-tRNA(Gln) amidotransferase subunit A [hydrothermal vent metagenome]|uniref:glutaminyl-tRNA synthase (glutamine-hydrolyzing) n=1 Tax=hydrothermal vent metagenome TaxID=652676 RepID=A0A3B0V0G0_9ZZZZ
MEYTGIKQISQALHNKDISVQELHDIYANRLDAHAEELNCLISRTPKLAQVQIKAAQALIDSGGSNILTGIPLVHKDLFCTKNILTTCGSRILENFTAPYNATIVENLNTTGMITMGKSNMDEFAMGSSNENSYFGKVKNPWDLNRVPGGSSGGSAAVVAAGLAPIATGTDTGGSIRQPAALCGITGIKPSYGRASRYGMVAFASSLDQAGVFARNAQDCAYVLAQMCGFDDKDSTSAQVDKEDFSQNLELPIKGIKIGVIPGWMDGLPTNIKVATEHAIVKLQDMGAHLIEVELPTAHLAVSAYYVIAPAECSSNLSRFDGIRYGRQCDNPKDLDDLYMRSRTEGFGDEVKRRIMVGTWALSAGFYDAYYRKAQKIRRLIAQDFAKAFASVDIIAAPVSPEVAFTFNAKKDPVNMYQADIYTIPSSLAGLPCMSLPIGMADNLPVGLQLIGDNLQESKILNIAHQYQQNNDFHQQIARGYDE